MLAHSQQMRIMLRLSARLVVSNIGAASKSFRPQNEQSTFWVITAANVSGLCPKKEARLSRRASFDQLVGAGRGWKLESSVPHRLYRCGQQCNFHECTTIAAHDSAISSTDLSD